MALAGTTVHASTSPRALAAWLPWTDRAGRVSWLKALAFACVCAPAVLIWLDADDAPSVTAMVLKQSGVWSMRLLIATLFVSPLRRITRWSRIIVIRRMLGLAALFYAVVHLLFYFADKDFDVGVIITEAVEVLFLTIGWLAFVGLVALGVTANDVSIRRLGSGAWNFLHKFVYLAAALAIVHFLLEIHIDADEIATISGLFLLSLLFRLAHRLRLGDGFWTLAVLSPLCGVATVLAETAYFRWWTGVDWRHVLHSNFEFEQGLRPGWTVALIGLVVAIGGLLIRQRIMRGVTGQASPGAATFR